MHFITKNKHNPMILHVYNQNLSTTLDKGKNLANALAMIIFSSHRDYCFVDETGINNFLATLHTRDYRYSMFPRLSLYEIN